MEKGELINTTTNLSRMKPKINAGSARCFYRYFWAPPALYNYISSTSNQKIRFVEALKSLLYFKKIKKIIMLYVTLCKPRNTRM